MVRNGAISDARRASAHAGGVMRTMTAADYAGMGWGTAVAVVCLASVGWRMASDGSIPSELAAEGASEAMQPAEPPNLLRTPPRAVFRRTALSLDTGDDVESTPVVNAHLEYTGRINQPVVEQPQDGE